MGRGHEAEEGPLPSPQKRGLFLLRLDPHPEHEQKRRPARDLLPGEGDHGRLRRKLGEVFRGLLAYLA